MRNGQLNGGQYASASSSLQRRKGTANSGLAAQLHLEQHLDRVRVRDNGDVRDRDGEREFRRGHQWLNVGSLHPVRPSQASVRRVAQETEAGH